MHFTMSLQEASPLRIFCGSTILRGIAIFILNRYHERRSRRAGHAERENLYLHSRDSHMRGYAITVGEILLEKDATLDARGLMCPMPIVHLAKKVKELKSGQVLELLAA